ncbi:peptidoglycan-binding domain-containing protein, partial [Rivularia sp. UHCC 0363]|uniref:peptidoglycan-binding domain-containing protein n=1 Tax=Rivularia sp. UHCC 0363 TaxID=3110244 RepID=UPI002B1EDA60
LTKSKQHQIFKGVSIMQATAIGTMATSMPTIRPNDTGDNVRILQRLLNAYAGRIENSQNQFSELSVDGVFGQRTLDAVRKFQTEYRQDRNLSTDPRDPNYFPVDGIVGVLTWRGLGDFSYRRCRVDNN